MKLFIVSAVIATFISGCLIEEEQTTAKRAMPTGIKPFDHNLDEFFENAVIKTPRNDSSYIVYKEYSLKRSSKATLVIGEYKHRQRAGMNGKSYVAISGGAKRGDGDYHGTIAALSNAEISIIAKAVSDANREEALSLDFWPNEKEDRYKQLGILPDYEKANSIEISIGLFSSTDKRIAITITTRSDSGKAYYAFDTDREGMLSKGIRKEDGEETIIFDRNQ